jgi:hypothetical protein
VSKEIKDLLSSRDEAESNIAALQENITQSADAAEGIAAKTQASEALLVEAQVEGDENRLQMLVDREQYLTLLLEEIGERMQSSSRDEAERAFVETELTALHAEAGALREKHQWSESFKTADPSISVPRAAAVDSEAVAVVVTEDPVEEERDEVEAEADEAAAEEEEVEEEEAAIVEEPSVTIEEVESQRTALADAIERVEEAESAIEACIEEEDFDTADELENSLQDLKARVATLQVWLNKHEGSVSSPVEMEEDSTPVEEVAEAQEGAPADEVVEEEEVAVESETPVEEELVTDAVPEEGAIAAPTTEERLAKVEAEAASSAGDGDADGSSSMLDAINGDDEGPSMLDALNGEEVGALDFEGMTLRQ